MPNERSKPPFPTEGPAYRPGFTWHEYFTEKRSEFKPPDPDPADDPDAGDDLPEPITITIRATEVPDKWFSAGAPRALITWRNRLLANDWEIKQGACQSWHEDRYYKNGKLDAPAHWEELWWVNAVKDGKYITVTYNIRNGAVYSARTSRTVRGEMRLYGDAEFKEMVENESA